MSKFKTIKGWPKYEINADGEVRSLSNKKNLNVDAKGMVRMYNESGKRVTAPLSELQPAEAVAPKKVGKIKQILELHKSGLSKKEIAEKGFNLTTVRIQVGKYEKALRK